ncbi:hypothetical protein SKTS_13430 [Sulfurimicrobium lacus]|uniref:Uncharacterized protein n=1 Tax=Sulfurimicrobium lacus TaxID=2715678 RepID=A0A6F8VBG7_9PROT|nr:hypothetical protein SKTS_13430 [Sulfurimicrobium lacus]
MRLALVDEIEGLDFDRQQQVVEFAGSNHAAIVAGGSGEIKAERLPQKTNPARGRAKLDYAGAVKASTGAV